MPIGWNRARRPRRGLLWGMAVGCRQGASAHKRVGAIVVAPKQPTSSRSAKARRCPARWNEGPLRFEWDRVNVSPRTETVESVGLAATVLQTYEEGYEINAAF